VNDTSGTYALQDDETPAPRYIPLPGTDPDAPEPGEERDREPEPFGIRLMKWDPFPLVMILSVLLWVGLGLAARRWPPMGLVLVGVGFLVFVIGRVYLYALIYRDDPMHGFLSFMFSWYRVLYLHFNLELTVRPTIISGCGLLMMLTGVFVFLNNAKLGG
jgi:hypothetical protein